MAQGISQYEFKRDDKAAGSIKLDTMESIYDASDGATDAPHRHEYFTVLWVQEGEGTHLIDFNEYALGKDQVFFVAPGQIHQVQTTRRPRGWVMTFHPDFLIESGIDSGFMTKINLFRQYSDSPPIELIAHERLVKIMDLLRDCFQDESPYKSEALGATLQLFLIECLRQARDREPVEDEAKSCVLIDFKNAVDRDFAARHKVSEYAEQLFITPKHLNEVIKSSIGITAKDYIIDRILTEAKRLLIHTNMTVKQIALTLGFSEPLHFNSFFKKRVEQTPLEFRKSKAS
ncbi:MAG: AraC family transcriptional regulator [Bacteroidota bacterium]